MTRNTTTKNTGKRTERSTENTGKSTGKIATRIKSTGIGRGTEIENTRKRTRRIWSANSSGGRDERRKCAEKRTEEKGKTCARWLQLLSPPFKMLSLGRRVQWAVSQDELN